MVAFCELAPAQPAALATFGDASALFGLEVTTTDSFKFHARSLSLRRAKR